MIAGLSNVPIAYLDQAHFSCIGRSEVEGRQTAHTILAARLEELVTAGKVICPYSYFHVLETAAWDSTANRHATANTIGRLSLGRCLRAPLEIVFDELGWVLDRSLVGRDVPRQRNVLGQGADVLAPNQIPPEVARFIEGLEPQRQFGAVVEWSRTANQSPAVTATYKKSLYAYALRKQRAPSRVSLEAARSRMRRGYLNPNGGAFQLLVEGSRRFRIPLDTIRTLFSAANIDDMPMVAMMAEIEARRYVAFRDKPTESDPTDDGHLDHLPYVTWMLTDRRAAALAREAGKHVGTGVMARPEDLLSVLSHL